jgi:tetratricopeptide (TPR) repeat protein
MKRLTLLSIAIALSGCSMIVNRDSDRAYEKPPFYAKYLDPAASAVDAGIQRDLDALRDNPRSATMHNDLGQLLVQKGFPKDAEVEFRRAIAADRSFYPAWYNLGMLQSARDDFSGARASFSEAVDLKPGHSHALFQLGLMEERRHNTGGAIDHYAKAISINHALLDVRTNPRLLDSKLIPLALLKLYPKEHNRASMLFQGTPPGYSQQGPQASVGQPAAAQPNGSQPPAAPSPQAPAQSIVTPSAPITDPGTQTPIPTPKP